MSAFDEYRMQRRTVDERPLDAPADEGVFWAGRSPAERLEALEFLRQVCYGYDPATTRFQKVLSVAKLDDL